MKDTVFTKVVGILITALLTLIIYTVQDTKAAVIKMQEDVTVLKVAVGKLEVGLNEK